MNKSNYPSIKNPFLYSKKIQDDEIYVIYGDIHGCLDELKSSMSWISNTINSQQNKQVTYIFLGDIVDRGPYSYEALEYIFSRQDTKVIMGNHEKKILRKLEGVEVTSNEDQKWYNQITEKQKCNILGWYQDVPCIFNLKTKTKEFFFAHAGIEHDVYNLNRDTFYFSLNSRQRDIALYGHTTGKKDSVTGFPIRLHEPCPDANIVNVFGHITHNSVTTNQWVKSNEPGTTIQLDHGGVHGGHLTTMILNSYGDYFFLSHKVNTIYMHSKTSDYSQSTEQRRVLYHDYKI